MLIGSSYRNVFSGAPRKSLISITRFKAICPPSHSPLQPGCRRRYGTASTGLAFWPPSERKTVRSGRTEVRRRRRSVRDRHWARSKAPSAEWRGTCQSPSPRPMEPQILRLRRRDAACAQDDNRRSSTPLRSARDDSTKEEQNGKGSMLFTWSLYLCRRRPTLPHTFACSTIGPAGLNFRVRDGNGCFPRGKITGNLRRFAGPGLKPRI